MKKYLIILLFLISFFLFAHHSPVKKLGNDKVHPFYVDVEIFNYNSLSKTFEITLRIFMDDAQKILEKNKIKADLFLEKDSVLIRKFYSGYIQHNLRLSCNGQFLPLEWVGFERENGIILFYVESKALSDTPKEVQVQSTLLCDSFDQSHIVEIHVNNTIRNSKIDCMNSIFKTQF